MVQSQLLICTSLFAVVDRATNTCQRIAGFWIARFRSEAAALCAKEAIVFLGDSSLKFQPYNQHASTVFVCKRVPQTVSEADLTLALKYLLPDQAIKVKWSKRTPMGTRTAALQLEMATNIRVIVGTLWGKDGNTRGNQMYFNVWLDTKSCGICKKGGHQTFDCRLLVHG